MRASQKPSVTMTRNLVDANQFDDTLFTEFRERLEAKILNTKPHRGRFVVRSNGYATRRETQRMTRIRTAWLFALAVGFTLTAGWLAVLPVRAQAVPAPQPGDFLVQHDVPMKTRDGVTLYADI